MPAYRIEEGGRAGGFGRELKRAANIAIISSDFCNDVSTRQSLSGLQGRKNHKNQKLVIGESHESHVRTYIRSQ